MVFKRIIKPTCDTLIAVILILLSLPFLIVLVVLLYFVTKDGVFFRQIRPGKDGRLFAIVKFKTMSDDRDVEGKLLPDELRMTKLGTFIRKFSLDEIPQLFNVLKRDMSIVGPRPLLPEYLPLYNEVQAKRHEVKPGITGWAQVNGRNAISWDKKFELDVWYVDNQSFLLDMKILWRTLLKVVRRDGISSDTSVTMEKFKGSAC